MVVQSKTIFALVVMVALAFSMVGIVVGYVSGSGHSKTLTTTSIQTSTITQINELGTTTKIVTVAQTSMVFTIGQTSTTENPDLVAIVSLPNITISAVDYSKLKQLFVTIEDNANSIQPSNVGMYIRQQGVPDAFVPVSQLGVGYNTNYWYNVTLPVSIELRYTINNSPMSNVSNTFTYIQYFNLPNLDYTCASGIASDFLCSQVPIVVEIDN